MIIRVRYNYVRLFLCLNKKVLPIFGVIVFIIGSGKCFFRRKPIKHPLPSKALVPRAYRCIIVFPYENKFSLGNPSIHR